MVPTGELPYSGNKTIDILATVSKLATGFEN